MISKTKLLTLRKIRSELIDLISDNIEFSQIRGGWQVSKQWPIPYRQAVFQKLLQSVEKDIIEVNFNNKTNDNELRIYYHELLDYYNKKYIEFREDRKAFMIIFVISVLLGFIFPIAFLISCLFAYLIYLKIMEFGNSKIL